MLRKSILTLLSGALLVLSVTAAGAQQKAKDVIDKTICTVGGEYILLSQIEEEVQINMAQGYTTVDDKSTRCRVLESILLGKLLLNQAHLDSLKVNNEYVELQVNDRLDRVMTQLGGQKETEEYFKMPLFKLKEDWMQRMSDQSLIEQERSKIVGEVVALTPKEVKKFYNRIDKDSLPVIPTQYRISQIVLYPSKEQAVMAVKEKLLEMRQRVLNGEKFSMLAALYSEDASNASRGGELRMASKNIYWPAFSDAAMMLKPGQVSQIVETPDGFHLIQMIEKDGDMFNARHILLKPKYTDEDRAKAFKTLDSIKADILADNMTFEMAARKYSQDMKTILNGGQMYDTETGSVFFEKDRLNPTDYNVIKDLKVGEISAPFESVSTDMYERGQVIYKILILDEILPSHIANVDDDFTVVQNFAENLRQNNALSEFIKSKQKVTYIHIDDLYKDCEFENPGWVK